MSLWDLSYPSVDGDGLGSSSRNAQHSVPAASNRHVAVPSLSSSRINLDAWEQLCPLDDVEKQSVILAARGLPTTHVFDPRFSDAPTMQPATLNVTKATETEDDVSKARAGSSQVEKASSPLSSLHGFNDWYETLTEAIDSRSVAQFIGFLEPLNAYVAICDDSLASIEDCRGLIREIEANWKFVDENAQSMEKACEGMLAGQKQLDSLAQSTAERLGYFQRLEEAQRLLSLPGEADVLNRAEFVDTLDRLEVCVEFMRSNHAFRDADLYLLRFQQCLTRAMTLIKIHFVNLLTSNGNDAAAKMSGKELSESAASALLYSKFSSLAQSIRPLLHELEKRSLNRPAEYDSLTSECFQSWFGLRSTLIVSRVALEIRRIENVSRDNGLAVFTNAGCSYLRSVCYREHSLVREFFAVAGRNELMTYMEALCDILFDMVRPRILHEQSLDVLCELCTALQALMALDPPPVSEDDDFSVPSTPPSPTSGNPQWIGSRELPPRTTNEGHSSRFLFAPLLGSLLQDVQTRLVFRSEALVQSDVLRYTPAGDDLVFPPAVNKGPERGSFNLGFQTTSDRDSALHIQLPSQEERQTWYPTVRTTLWVLSRIHTFVNDSIFEDFAIEAVRLCRQSLAAASQQMRSHPGARSSDASLFEIRHLLILRDLARSLNLGQVDRGFDISSMTTALTDLLRNSAAFLNPNALLRLAHQGLPSLTDSARDPKIDLDGHLRVSCEAFISSEGQQVCSDLLAFLARSAAFLAPGSGSPAASSHTSRDLPSQAWASNEVVVKMHAQFWASVDASLPDMRARIASCLQDDRTTEALMSLLQRELTSTYTTWFNFVSAQYSHTTSKVLLHPVAAQHRLAEKPGC